MKRTRLAAAAGIAALLLTALPSAQAAPVAKKDLPGKRDFAKVVPALSGATFTTTSDAGFVYPSSTDCGYDESAYGTSGLLRVGEAAYPGPLGGVQVV